MVSRGIDISKSSFVAAYPSTNGNPTKTFPNTTARMRELIGTLAVAEHHCVMEATSNYGCCCTCYIRTVLPSVLPPPKKQIKHFSRMMMPVTKTDEKDAYMIAMYGEKMNPPIYKMPSQAILLLKQKKTVIRQLRKQLVASKNLRGSLIVLPYRDKACVRTLDKTIDFLTKQIEQLEAELADTASSEFDKQLKALTSIKGIGITLATALILTTGGFTCFDNAKQLSRFIGICPTYQQSRTSVNIREHINRNDDERLRSLLYIAFWTALRYNSRECYIRLKANEKPFKVALIAVTNKLVRPVLTITTINSIYRWICPG